MGLVYPVPEPARGGGADLAADRQSGPAVAGTVESAPAIGDDVMLGEKYWSFQ